MFRIIAVIFLVILSVPAYSQNIKKQIYAGFGTTAGINGTPSAVNISSGFALVIPVSSKFFIRPLIGANLVNPTGNVGPFPSLQAAGLAGIKLTRNFNFLAGGGEIINLPKGKSASYVPTAIIATATHLNSRFLLFTPVALNKKGIGTNIQIGYSW